MRSSGLGSMEGVMILDTEQRYHYIDKDEVQWAFIYAKIGEDEGWWAWMAKPGNKEICIGRIPASEVVKKIEENPPLTKDDLIDLELWINSGGLAQYEPRKEKDGNR